MTDEEKVKIDLAWKYFDLHAKQRVNMFQYFSAIVPVVAGAYFYFFKDHALSLMPGVMPSIAILGLVISIAFLLLDYRNEQLLDISRRQLCQLEQQLYGDGLVGIFGQARALKAGYGGCATFGLVMPAIYWIAAAVFLVLGSYSALFGLASSWCACP